MSPIAYIAYLINYYMSNLVQHNFHLVDESPWPFVRSCGALYLTCGLVKWFHIGSLTLTFFGLRIILLVIYQWWKDILTEASYQGHHRSLVELGLRFGMGLFIISEVMFFVSFFWAFFHSRLNVTPELGARWPPAGIQVFNPLEVPLLNTIVLLVSGCSVTWSHHALIEGNHSQQIAGLVITIILGLYFTCLQGFEYYEANFTISDRVYGSSFFLITGFHGLHVLIGTTFLLICLIRAYLGQLGAKHHFGFEAAAWYWHFVDVVWLYVYLILYWWGGY